MRRAQLLSLDAMLSLIIMIFVFAAVVNTSAALKGEITSMLGWYERANIADNMLDVLTKSPGDPVDWENNINTTVDMVGLRDENHPFALSYEKIIALNELKDNLKPILSKLAHGKDFLLEIYVSKFNVSLSGRFPRIYLQNYTFGLNNPSGGANFKIDSAGTGREFRIKDIFLKKADGSTYNLTTICDFAKNNKKGNGKVIDLEPGDYLRIVTAEPVSIDDTKDNKKPIIVPADTTIELYVQNIDKQSKFHINFDPNNCPWQLKITGQGNVVVTVSAYDNTTPVITSNYTGADIFLENSQPFYWFSLINGEFEPDMNKVKESMSNSSWIEPAVRRAVFLRPSYNLSAGPSAEEPIVYGFMKYNVLDGEAVRISVDSEINGNLTLIAQLGTEVRGMFIYGNRENLNATLVWYEYKNGTRTPRLKKYTSTDGNTIVIPFKDLFGSTDTQDKVIVLWLYSLEGWRRNEVEIQFVPDIGYMIEPKFDETIIKLLVWDEP